MPYRRHHRLVSAFSLSGLGIHTGTVGHVEVLPGPPGFGLRVFRVEDGTGGSVGSLDRTGTSRCTTVFTQSGLRIMTVEHAFAALAAMGVGDADIWLQGDEFPILDGSAAPWIEKISDAGLAPSRPGPSLEVTRRFAFSWGASRYEVEPGRFSASVSVDYPSPIGFQNWSLDGYASVRSASPARTFSLESDIPEIARRGLAVGATLANALVIGPSGPLNPGGWRMEKECAAHKAIDFVGDLLLSGFPVSGRFSVYRPGHESNNRFLSAILKEDVVRRVPVDERASIAEDVPRYVGL